MAVIIDLTDTLSLTLAKPTRTSPSEKEFNQAVHLCDERLVEYWLPVAPQQGIVTAFVTACDKGHEQLAMMLYPKLGLSAITTVEAFGSLKEKIAVGIKRAISRDWRPLVILYLDKLTELRWGVWTTANFACKAGRLDLFNIIYAKANRNDKRYSSLWLRDVIAYGHVHMYATLTAVVRSAIGFIGIDKAIDCVADPDKEESYKSWVRISFPKNEADAILDK